jgi:RNA polymerase sigma-70 factor (ECF subfamily)
MAPAMERTQPARPVAGGRADDRALVDAVLSGDSDAFQLLVEREARLVIGVCTRILRDPAEAEDVAQEAFLKAYASLATFRGDASFGAWVTRIAVRRAGARLSARRDAWSLDNEAHEQTGAAALASATDLELETIDAEARRALWDAVAGLPKDQREAVTLRFAHDLTVDEIAARTGSPAGTVKSRLHRAMASLRGSVDARTGE